MKKIKELYTGNRIRITVVLIFVVGFVLIKSFGKNTGYFPEVAYLSDADFSSFIEVERYFKDVADKKGAKYAFDLLKVAPLPKDTDIHLLGHAVGNILYKQEGLNGIGYCTPDFRNACSHSIVVGLFIDRGLDALPDISNVCRKAPGGEGAYTMCFHGLGHGILAYTNYDLLTTIDLCRKTGTEEFSYRESAECIGGAIMELTGGVHDKEALDKARLVYFSQNDPLYPCNQGFIPSNSRNLCFLYLTPHLWESAGIKDVSEATSSELKESMDYCSNLDGDLAQYRASCYAGFGKEFVVLAQDRDLRKLEDAGSDSLSTVYEMCLLTDDVDGRRYCFLEALNSLYWGGENDPQVSVRYCSLMDREDSNICFSHLVGAINFYNRSPIKKRSECRAVPEEFRKVCNEQK